MKSPASGTAPSETAPYERAHSALERSAHWVLETRKAIDTAIHNHAVALRDHEKALAAVRSAAAEGAGS